MAEKTGHKATFGGGGNLFAFLRRGKPAREDPPVFLFWPALIA